MLYKQICQVGELACRGRTPPRASLGKQDWLPHVRLRNALRASVRPRPKVPVRRCQISALESTLALIADCEPSILASTQLNAIRKFPVSSTMGEARHRALAAGGRRIDRVYRRRVEDKASRPRARLREWRHDAVAERPVVGTGFWVHVTTARPSRQRPPRCGAKLTVCVARSVMFVPQVPSRTNGSTRVAARIAVFPAQNAYEFSGSLVPCGKMTDAISPNSCAAGSPFRLSLRRYRTSESDCAKFHPPAIHATTNAMSSKPTPRNALTAGKYAPLGSIDGDLAANLPPSKPAESRRANLSAVQRRYPGDDEIPVDRKNRGRRIRRDRRRRGC